MASSGSTTTRQPSKQLWQVDWSGGMTDGDVGKDTVFELKNVEIDVPGVLGCRDELEQDTSVLKTDVIDIQHMTNPIDSDEVITVTLRTGHTGTPDVNATLDLNSATVTESIDLGLVLDDTSTLLIKGADVWICVIASGAPAGMLCVAYVESAARFAAPALLESHTSASPEAVGTDAWQLLDSDLTPSLLVTEIESTGQYLTDGPAWLTANPDNGVVIGYSRVDEQTYGEFIAEVSYAAEIAVQFVFHNDQVGPLSDSFVASTASITADSAAASPYTSCLGLSLMVNKTLHEGVKAIHVYRKVLYIDGEASEQSEYELLYTAWVYSDDVEASVTVGADAQFSIPWVRTRVLKADETTLGSTLVATIPVATSDCTTYTNETNIGWIQRSLVGEVRTSSGWLEHVASTGHMSYLNDATIGQGDWTLEVRFDADGDNVRVDANDYWYKVVYNDTTALIDLHGSPSSTIAIYGNSYMPYSAKLLLGPTGHNWNMVPCAHTKEEIGVSTFPWPATGWGKDVAFRPIHVGTAGTASAGDNYNTTSTSIPTTSWYVPIVMHTDLGNAGLLTLDEIVGVAQDDISEVSGRTVGFAGGRLISLNVDQDGDTQGARLCYSEFRRYNTFSKSNYIDYGPRDDGVGVALAEFAGRLLVLHTTAAYVLDISGGSDMAWREIGAYPEIGCAGNNFVVTTPNGVFFGDADYAYLFDGQKIHNIVDLGARHIMSTYRNHVGGNDSTKFMWRPDKRQLWVFRRTVGGLSALVLDADTLAWHRHELDELPAMGMARGFASIGGSVYLKLITTTDYAEMWNFAYTAGTRPFEWGLDTGLINMGSSEFSKKLKRVYIDTRPNAGATGDLTVYVGSNSVTFTPAASQAVTRLSFSDRGYQLRIKVYAEGASSWSGNVESLGMSFKAKKLK